MKNGTYYVNEVTTNYPVIVEIFDGMYRPGKFNVRHPISDLPDNIKLTPVRR
jgi:hypothetical protein